jgi:iron-sulfur cluster assembly accessory protein
MIKEINFSQKAVEKINHLISKKPLGTFFRISVKGGGCSGFKYDFSFDTNIENDDLKHENIIIDKSSLKILEGSSVDFAEDLIGTSFKISNPKTKSSCGCGISFSF